MVVVDGCFVNGDRVSEQAEMSAFVLRPWDRAHLYPPSLLPLIPYLSGTTMAWHRTDGRDGIGRHDNERTKGREGDKGKEGLEMTG